MVAVLVGGPGISDEDFEVVGKFLAPIVSNLCPIDGQVYRLRLVLGLWQADPDRLRHRLILVRGRWLPDS